MQIYFGKFSNLGWTIPQWNQLHDVEFVPAYVLNQSYFLSIAMQVLQQYLEDQRSVLRDLDRCIAKRRKTNVRKGANLQIGDTSLQGSN